MIGKFLNLFKRNKDYSYGIYEDERFIITNHDIIIDKKSRKSYFMLNPSRYKISGDVVVDKIADEFAYRNIEYIRFDLTRNNKILDKITQKEYDNLEEIVLLLNSQNQFIDNTKDVLEDEIKSANRNRRYASEVGAIEEMNKFIDQRKALDRIYEKLFSEEYKSH